MERRQGSRQYSKPPTYVWRPCIPTWEREFTLKIGNLKWKKFVEAKKYTRYDDKVMNWNDSACEEAFNIAKKKFYNQYFNKTCSDQIIYDPDMYIDKIIDSDPIYEDEVPMMSISEGEEETIKNEEMNEMNGTTPLLRDEVIVPTGWDIEIPKITNDLLTGLIVGESENEDEGGKENILRDSTNADEKLPVLRKFRRIV